MISGMVFFRSIFPIVLGALDRGVEEGWREEMFSCLCSSERERERESKDEIVWIERERERERERGRV